MFKAAAIFSSHMVLQRQKPIAVWGSSSHDTVAVSFNGITVKGTVSNGTWRIQLPPMEAGGPYEMQLTSGGETITFVNVMLGEVWLAGGQSNMELELQNAKNGETVLAALTPQVPVRYYYTPKQRYRDAQFESIEENTCWAEASPENSRAWSAVAFYCARRLAQRLGVTVGIIGCNWGGTSAANWMSRQRLEACTELRPYLDDLDKAMEGKTLEQHIREFDEYLAYSEEWNRKKDACYQEHPDYSWDKVQEVCGKCLFPGPMGPKNEYRPVGLYETMLQRVCPYSLRGFLYYQGESDDHRPQLYYRLFTELIGQWRQDWEDDTLPFVFVQLPMFRYKQDADHKHWCLIREAQMRAYQTVKHTGIAVIPDCGELDNIHPTDKEPVGERLAIQAMQVAYGIQDPDQDTPMFRDSYVTGNTMHIRLTGAPKGFLPVEHPTGFELAGADRIFHPAEAVLGENQITLRAEGISEPVYGRYAWTNYMEVQVFSKNGIPLAPFRTSQQDAL